MFLEGFLGVWLLRTCQVQGRVAWGSGVPRFSAWEHGCPCLPPYASGHHPVLRWPAPEHVFKGLFGQVILCTKEVSVGARKNAFALLVEMGHAFLRFGPNQEGEVWVTRGWGRRSAHRPWGGTPPNHWPKRKGGGSCLALELGRLLLSGRNPLPWAARGAACRVALPSCDCPRLTLPEALQRYLVLIYPGLVGAVTMVSCSILALTHLLFEFKGEWCFFEGLGSHQGGKMPRRS